MALQDPHTSFGLVDLSNAIAGGAGGLVRYLLKPTVPPLRAAASGAGSLLAALYFAPVLGPTADYYLDKLIGDGRVDEGSVSVAIACLIGMTAPNLLERLIEWVRTTKAPGASA